MMKPRTIFSLLALFVVMVIAAPRADQGAAQPPAGAGRQGPPGGGQGRGGQRPPRARKVVLAWADTRNGQAQHEFTSHALSVIERLGYESGAYDTFIRTDSNIIANQPKKTTGE